MDGCGHCSNKRLVRTSEAVACVGIVDVVKCPLCGWRVERPTKHVQQKAMPHSAARRVHQEESDRDDLGEFFDRHRANNGGTTMECLKIEPIEPEATRMEETKQRGVVLSFSGDDAEVLRKFNKACEGNGLSLEENVAVYIELVLEGKAVIK